MTMLWIFAACLPEPSAELQGQILDQQDQPIPNANITIRDQQGDIFSSSVADNNGDFLVNLPPLEPFFAVLSTDEMPPQSFTGYAGEGSTTAEVGSLWLRTQGELESSMEDFPLCDSSGLGMIDGEVRVAIPEQETESLPLITTATVVAIDVQDISRPGCYPPEFPDDDPDNPIESNYSGESGRFSVMGLPTGRYILQVSIEYDNSDVQQYDHLIYVPEEGSAPLYPALIPLL